MIQEVLYNASESSEDYANYCGFSSLAFHAYAIKRSFDSNRLGTEF